MIDRINEMSASKRDRVLKSVGAEFSKRDAGRRNEKLRGQPSGEKFYVDMPTKGPLRDLQALKRTSAMQLRKDPITGKIEMVPSGTLMVEPEQQTGMYMQSGTGMSEIEGAIAELKARGEYKPIYDTEPMALATAINRMYEGPDLPYDQQVEQAVRSAGYPPAMMFGERPDSLMERNLAAQRSARSVEGPMLGPEPAPRSSMGRIDRSNTGVVEAMVADARKQDVAPAQPSRKLPPVGSAMDFTGVEPLTDEEHRRTYMDFTGVEPLTDEEHRRTYPELPWDRARTFEPAQPQQMAPAVASAPPEPRADLVSAVENIPFIETSPAPAGTGAQSMTLAKLRGNPAYDVGFRRFLQEREQYQSSQRPSIAEEEEFFKGGSLYAESARERAIGERDNASIEALGFAEGQEFAERETQRSVDRALRGGLRMEPTREDIAYMESVGVGGDVPRGLKMEPTREDIAYMESVGVGEDIPPEML
jgi:hypothetical protein